MSEPLYTRVLIRVILFVSPPLPFSPPSLLSSFLRYLFQDGLARFATEKYSTKTKALKNRFMHLTNYSINKKQEKYEKNDDKDNDMTGSKWSLQALRRCVQERRDALRNPMRRAEREGCQRDGDGLWNPFCE